MPEALTKQDLKEELRENDGLSNIVKRLEKEIEIIKEDLRRVKEVIKEKLGVDLT